MASIGQIIFWSMIVLIVIFSSLIILILATAFSGSQGVVEGTDLSPVGNLGQDVVLNCRFRSSTGNGGRLGAASITWVKEGLSGVVYQFSDSAPQLQDQNEQFKDRTRLFSDAIAMGNASLLLMSVRKEDEGRYLCSVSASGISGTIGLNLRVAAFTAPNFTLSEHNLTTAAPRWFPQPTVFWMDGQGNPLNDSTWFSNISAGLVRVDSSLTDPVNVGVTYTCVIENAVVKAVSRATVMDGGAAGQTLFVFNVASPKLRTFCMALPAICLFSNMMT